jgi:hypothetical protein
MVAARTSITRRNVWQSSQLDLSTQSINDPQQLFQPQGGLACLKVDDEAHSRPTAESQLGLRQPELLASGTQFTP